MLTNSQNKDAIKFSKNADDNTTHISTRDLYVYRPSLETFSQKNNANDLLSPDSKKADTETILSPRTESEPSYDGVCSDNMIVHENGRIVDKGLDLTVMKKYHKKQAVKKIWSKLNFWSRPTPSDKNEPSSKTATSLQPFSDKDRSSAISSDEISLYSQNAHISLNNVVKHNNTSQRSRKFDEADGDDEFDSNGLTDQYTQPDMWAKQWEQQATSRKI